MPIYEYLCPVCETKFERLRPFSQADEPLFCPQEHPGARRVPSTFMASVGRSTWEPTALPGTRPDAPRAKRSDY